MNDAKLSCDTISYADFVKLLETYKNVVPTKLEELEEQRLKIIPKALSERTGDGAHLTKAELQTLVDWKLGHGTFRPSLRKLVGSNSEAAVEECTREALQTYNEAGDQWSKAVAMLTKGLRGVGPATASLLLNTYDGEKVPFFSDELFRWVMLSEGKGLGWDRKIKYSIKEYQDLFKRVEKLRERLSEEGKTSITSIDVEMVAYVLGQRRDTGGKRKAAEVVEAIKGTENEKRRQKRAKK